MACSCDYKEFPEGDWGVKKVRKRWGLRRVEDPGSRTLHPKQLQSHRAWVLLPGGAIDASRKGRRAGADEEEVDEGGVHTAPRGTPPPKDIPALPKRRGGKEYKGEEREEARSRMKRLAQSSIGRWDGKEGGCDPG